jgi:hypothetical protein
MLMQRRSLLLLVMLTTPVVGCADRDGSSPPLTHQGNQAPLDDQQTKQDKGGAKSTGRPPVKYIDGTFCPRGSDKFLLREKWKNVGDRPIRTLYMTITVYNKDGKKVHEATDYPIYSVPDSEPGVLPGQTYEPGINEGYIIPIGVGHPDEPKEVTGKYTKAAEKGIK